MLDKSFDPNKFIDREFEQELFEELLQFKDDARILAIRDAGGMGKSQLLQRFQYRCRTAGRPRTPVALIDLGQLPDSSPLALVQQMEKEFSSFSLQFSNFRRLESARRSHDFSTIRGAVDLRGADMRSAHITTAGVMTNVTQADSVTVLATAVTFNPEQQAMAQEICVNAFLDDLKTHCQQQPLVVLFDAFEKCELELQNWLLNHFLEPHCFNVQERPAQLVVVVAGRETPAFEQHWSPDECKSIVKSRESLGTWSAAHVEECLRVHGFSYNQRQLTLFCMMIEEGYSPSHVVGAMEMLYLKRER